MEKLFTVAEFEAAVPVAKGMSYKPDFRAAIGLPAVKIGRRLFFRESDVQALIDRSVEQLPIMPSKRGNDAA